jgi:hypothetical protein
VGDSAADDLALHLESNGLTVEREVDYWTIFGIRRADIRVSQDGQVLGLIEVKVGDSAYHASQRAKDAWLYMTRGLHTTIVRYPTNPF